MAELELPRLYADLVELWPLVSPPESYPEEVASFRARFSSHGVADGSRVLHLGCGGGSIDYHLKQYYEVTGVDLSDGMLAHARRLNPEVNYVQGDMRTCRLGQLFDAVLVHDAISYMTSADELRAVYGTAAAHLRAGGVLVALPEELRSRLDTAAARTETHSDGHRTVTLVELSHDPDHSDNSYEQVYLFVIREGDDLRVEVDRHLHGVFELGDFTAAMESVGFTTQVEPWELSSWAADEEPLPLITAVRVG